MLKAFFQKENQKETLFIALILLSLPSYFSKSHVTDSEHFPIGSMGNPFPLPPIANSYS